MQTVMRVYVTVTTKWNPINVTLSVLLPTQLSKSRSDDANGYESIRYGNNQVKSNQLDTQCDKAHSAKLI